LPIGNASFQLAAGWLYHKTLSDFVVSFWQRIPISSRLAKVIVQIDILLIYHKVTIISPEVSPPAEAFTFIIPEVLPAISSIVEIPVSAFRGLSLMNSESPSTDKVTGRIYSGIIVPSASVTEASKSIYKFSELELFLIDFFECLLSYFSLTDE